MTGIETTIKRGPGRAMTIGTRGKGAKSIQVYLPTATLEDIDSVSREQEARTAFIRTAIREEVQRRREAADRALRKGAS